MENLTSNRLYLALIAAFSFVLFANTIGHDFAWDDRIVLLDNEHVQQGIGGIPDLFYKYNSDLLQDKYGYRPITLCTFAVEYSLFGLNPAGFHFMNVLYFCLLSMLIFIFIRSVFPKLPPYIPLLITLLFAAHPMHTEVVANVKSRDEILALLFGLLFLLYSLKAYREQRSILLLPAILFFALAYLSRENALTYLLVLPVVLWTAGELKRKYLLRGLAIIPILGVLAFAIFNAAQSSTLGVEQTSGMAVFQENHILGNSFFHDDQIATKMGNAVQLTTAYIGKFLLPYPLTYYSGASHVPHWNVVLRLLSAMFLLGAFIYLPYRWRRKHPLFLFGALFFLFTLSVYLHLAQSLSDTMADRFLFGPSLGLCIIVGGLVHFFLEKRSTSVERWKELPSTFRYGVFGILGVFSILTIARNSVWADNFTLVSSDMPHLENCARAHYFYASELNQKLQEEGWDSAMEQEMILHYERSLELSKDIYYGRLELGTYYLNHDSPEKGTAILKDMVTLFPEAGDPLYFLGQRLVQTEKYHEAVPLLEKCLKIAPNSHDATYLLAIAYGKTGNSEKALQLANEGLTKYPEAKGNMYDALGHIYFDMGNVPSSVDATLHSIDFGRDAYTSYATVIARLQSVGDSANALRFYQQAIDRGIMQIPAQGQ